MSAVIQQLTLKQLSTKITALKSATTPANLLAIAANAAYHSINGNPSRIAELMETPAFAGKYRGFLRDNCAHKVRLKAGEWSIEFSTERKVEICEKYKLTIAKDGKVDQAAFLKAFYDAFHSHETAEKEKKAQPTALKKASKMSEEKRVAYELQVSMTDKDTLLTQIAAMEEKLRILKAAAK